MTSDRMAPSDGTRVKGGVAKYFQKNGCTSTAREQVKLAALRTQVRAVLDVPRRNVPRRNATYLEGLVGFEVAGRVGY